MSLQQDTKRRLIIGCGYLGQRAARRWVAAGDTVFALTRSPDRVTDLSQQGIQPLVADIARRDSLPNLPEVDTVLLSVGFDRSAGQAIETVFVDGIANLVESLPPATPRLIYISSTGVYGQTDGDWINERSPCRPTRAGGKACLAAEKMLESNPLGERTIRLRMAGLYGPGRIPRRSELEQGLPIAAASSGWLNLIHVDDAAQIVIDAANYRTAPDLFVVSDGAPVQRREYFRELARLLHASEPTFTLPDPQSHAAQRAGADKRVDNAKLRKKLQPSLMYPSYREGLAACVD